ncbi:MAG: DUF503 domain-containing protein [Candidatus Aminicenantaceae bacterium]
MVVGFLLLEIYLPYSHSLKEKRKRLKSIRDKLKNRYNVAFAEVDYQDKWQRSTIGVVTLNNQKEYLETVFIKIVEDAEKIIDGEILNYEIQYF